MDCNPIVKGRTLASSGRFGRPRGSDGWDTPVGGNFNGPKVRLITVAVESGIDRGRVSRHHKVDAGPRSIERLATSLCSFIHSRLPLILSHPATSLEFGDEEGRGEEGGWGLEAMRACHSNRAYRQRAWLRRFLILTAAPLVVFFSLSPFFFLPSHFFSHERVPRQVDS